MNARKRKVMLEKQSAFDATKKEAGSANIMWYHVDEMLSSHLFRNALDNSNPQSTIIKGT